MSRPSTAPTPTRAEFDELLLAAQAGTVVSDTGLSAVVDGILEQIRTGAGDTSRLVVRAIAAFTAGE